MRVSGYSGKKSSFREQNMVDLYNIRESMEDIKSRISDNDKTQEGKKAMIIGGNFNAGISNRGANKWMESNEDVTIRKSRDTILDKMEKYL